MKVIEESKEFHLSIKDVIFASSDRRFHTSSIPLRIRASKGTEVHVAFQEKRSQSEKQFQKEATVKILADVQDWKFSLLLEVDESDGGFSHGHRRGAVPDSGERLRYSLGVLQLMAGSGGRFTFGRSDRGRRSVVHHDP